MPSLQRERLPLSEILHALQPYEHSTPLTQKFIYEIAGKTVAINKHREPYVNNQVWGKMWAI